MPPSAIAGRYGACIRTAPRPPSTLLSLRRRAARAHPTPHSSPCRITRRRRSPAQLAARGAGGFVCFSSGLLASWAPSRVAELDAGARRSMRGRLPFFGPNCYGFVNFFDRAAMLPDQVVGATIERGVALICQSGTISLTLELQRALRTDRLSLLGGQPDPPGGRGSHRDSVRRSARDGVRPVSRGDQGRGKIRARGGQGAPRGQAHRGGQDRAAPPPRRARRTATPVRLRARTACSTRFAARPASHAATRSATCARRSSCFTSGGALEGRKVLIMGASGGDMAMTADVARTLDLDFAPDSARAGGARCASS